MKILKSSLGVLALCATLAVADFIPTSRFFLNPDTGKILVKKSADFWRTQKDETNGGYFNNYIKPDGSRLTGTLYNYKHFSPQSRLAYVFARAFMVTGDTTYLNDADYALEFLYQHGWAPATDSGGWYYQAGLDGSKPTGSNDVYGNSAARWSYMQHYALLGPTTVFEAQGGQRFARNAQSPNHWDWIVKGLAFNEKRLWDSRAGYEGYYNYYSPATNLGTGKGFTPTVDAITTHADNLVLITDSAAFKTRLAKLGDAMADHMVGSMDSMTTVAYPTPSTVLPVVAWGMPEEFGSDWSLGSPYAMVGHTIKTVWCLGRVHLSMPNAKYVRAAERVFDSAWVQGLVDTVNGGPYYDYNYNYKSLASLNTNKNYWMLEQGFNAGMMLARLTSDPLRRARALRLAQGSVDFFYKYLAQSNGSVIMQTEKDGTSPSAYVGDEWDAGYHATEFAWLVYLYGNLLNDHKTITLYYKLAPSASAQNIRLTPLRLPGDSLAILSVKKDGKSFTSFVPNTRTLRLSAKQGGVFQVTFGYRNALTDAASPALPAIAASAKEPHWDARARTLFLNLGQTQHVRVQTVDARGQVRQWTNEVLAAGAHSIAIPENGSGVRWLVVRSAQDTWSKAIVP